ncbi:DUF2147 domain-containing protein [Acidiluteibacter ferrifornacis]|uniref:DUF2147 domain-containing protein n=1 Tax=Acidiluteibacter ferrifornacis TaxID=2692424 RepID=A0A6N9NLA0_9FLAO|nr:DUF2147 domain-containing protein [Acidiluteibacter ferrifornacis]NBG66629.1 DUF2147 domain-containing protein [Acidiluteibacter ferrifornacis]
MKIKLIMLTFFASIFAVSAYAQGDIFGKWKTIDDETGKPKSIVEIYKKDGKAYGKIVKLFREPGEDQDPICDKCEDYRKDKKIIGMTIITGMEYDEDDKEWDDGEILDPKKGTIYDCKLWLEDGDLQVRGYIAFFFRTQTWKRVE